MLAFKQIFYVIVDYTKTLEQMIEAELYDGVGDGINDINFPVEPRESNVEVIILDFIFVITSDEVLVELDKAGYRPATLVELIAFGAKYKYSREQSEISVVALGSCWQDCVPVLCCGGNVWYLRLSGYGGRWDRYRFAAVRKAS